MNRFNILVSDLCFEIDILEKQLKEVTEREKYWQEKYNSMLTDNIKHSEAMMGNMLNIMLIPEVTNAFKEHAVISKFTR